MVGTSLLHKSSVKAEQINFHCYCENVSKYVGLILKTFHKLTLRKLRTVRIK